MSKILTKAYQLKILKLLFHFSEDEKFHEIPNSLLNLIPQQDKYIQLQELKDLELVIFKDDLKYESPPVIFLDLLNHSTSSISAPENDNPIYGKITDTGKKVVEKYNQTNHEI